MAEGITSLLIILGRVWRECEALGLHHDIAMPLRDSIRALVFLEKTGQSCTDSPGNILNFAKEALKREPPIGRILK